MQTHLYLIKQKEIGFAFFKKEKLNFKFHQKIIFILNSQFFKKNFNYLV